ncbi:ABC transporter substrate-binding protein [Corynebacterium comes]|uniref:Choline-binding protein n=1 Tax=Corynebacterium comes TaxID=2675218 RepID=A0A6B8W2J7_9CORY|nr:ABC transporter substrate-binding protein [Corynebacterium comes]QGU05645.1 Choline-binding protein precursor [Corynebacterium comes]
MRIRSRHTFIAAAALLGLTLSACTSTSEDPLGADSADSAGTIVLGTANFPESEIVGQIWAAALEDAGFDVEVSSAIGSREVYLRALEEGSIDLVPEYIGNLAQYYLADSGSGELAAGADTDEVYAALQDNLPAGTEVGDYAEGESKDSYRVTRELADEQGLVTLADLGKLDRVRIAAAPEFEQRPYGPTGLSEVYGVDAGKISMVPISDGGGPLTIAALREGTADVADIYTTSPLLDSQGNEIDLVALEDPERLILPQNIVPLMRAGELPQEAVDAINGINEHLTTEALVEMNLRNIGDEKAEAPVIARDFVDENV